MEEEHVDFTARIDQWLEVEAGLNNLRAVLLSDMLETEATNEVDRLLGEATTVAQSTRRQLETVQNSLTDEHRAG